MAIGKGFVFLIVLLDCPVIFLIIRCYLETLKTCITVCFVFNIVWKNKKYKFKEKQLKQWNRLIYLLIIIIITICLQLNDINNSTTIVNKFNKLTSKRKLRKGVQLIFFDFNNNKYLIFNTCKSVFSANRRFSFYVILINHLLKWVLHLLVQLELINPCYINKLSQL